jgi:hypothetical protein
MTQEKISYYRFWSPLNLPIFIKLGSEEYKEKFRPVLEQCYFSEIKEEEFKKLTSVNNRNLRVLIIENLKKGLEQRLLELSYSGRIGKESITPYRDYYLYRYQRQALLMYSFRHTEWRLGISDLLFTDPFGMRLVINRFLGWSLSPCSCVGLWGELIDNKILVSGAIESQARSVIIHVEDGLYTSNNLASGKVEKVSDFFHIVHVEPQLREERRMNRDELYGFIMARCTFFHGQRLDLPMRQLIYNLARVSIGLRTPQSFAKQTDKVLSIDVNPSMLKG